MTRSNGRLLLQLRRSCYNNDFRQVPDYEIYSGLLTDLTGTRVCAIQTGDIDGLGHWSLHPIRSSVRAYGWLARPPDAPRTPKSYFNLYGLYTSYPTQVDSLISGLLISHHTPQRLPQLAQVATGTEYKARAAFSAVISRGPCPSQLPNWSGPANYTTQLPSRKDRLTGLSGDISGKTSVGRGNPPSLAWAPAGTQAQDTWAVITGTSCARQRGFWASCSLPQPRLSWSRDFRLLA